MAPKVTLTQMRRRRLLSATALAAKAHVAASTITAIERGVVPRLSTIGKLAQALDADPTDIAWPGDPLGGEEEPNGPAIVHPNASDSE